MNKDRDIRADKADKSRNPDPITGAPGSHPIGTGLGAAAGGMATGAAVGSVAGPVGTAAGAAVGAIVGGLIGKGVAEKIDPTLEDAYWRENHGRQGWAQTGSYDDFSPAYRVGYEGYARHGGVGTFEDREEELRRDYEKNRPKLAWDKARPASLAAWQKFEQKNPSDTSIDTYGNPRQAESATGILDEIKVRANRTDARLAEAYREGLKDAAGFMGLANAMSDKRPEKKELQDRFSCYCKGDFA